MGAGRQLHDGQLRRTEFPVRGLACAPPRGPADVLLCVSAIHAHGGASVRVWIEPIILLAAQVSNAKSVCVSSEYAQAVQRPRRLLQLVAVPFMPVRFECVGGHILIDWCMDWWPSCVARFLDRRRSRTSAQPRCRVCAASLQKSCPPPPTGQVSQVTLQCQYPTNTSSRALMCTFSVGPVRARAARHFVCVCMYVL